MTEFCNCGAQLPPDALFCHKCGKPQRDIVVPENQVVALPPALEVPPRPTIRIEQMPLTFHNPIAVRIGLLVALSATLLSMTVLQFVSWPAAGFFAVLLYRRRTGIRVNVGGGARLGMITGVLMAAMSTIVLSIALLPAAFSGRLLSVMQDQMKNFAGRDQAQVQQMFHSLSNTDFAFGLVFGLMGVFVLITGLSAAGGALGAKFGGRG
jgi:hypothetical protein